MLLLSLIRPQTTRPHVTSKRVPSIIKSTRIGVERAAHRAPRAKGKVERAAHRAPAAKGNHAATSHQQRTPRPQPAVKRRMTGVLINTPGGSASTLLMQALYKAGVPTNNRFNAEKNLKHGNANVQRTRLRDCDSSPTRRCLVVRERTTEFTFHVIVYIISADPAKAVLSTARRWPTMQHQVNLAHGCPECWHAPPSRQQRSKLELNRDQIPPSWRGKVGDMLFRSIFKTSADLGRDSYGIQAHFDAWALAQRVEASQWPPIMICDIGTLLRDVFFECAFFQFLGIKDESVRATIRKEMKQPDNLVIRLNRHKPGEKALDPRDYMDTTSFAVYANLSSAIERTLQENRAHYKDIYAHVCANYTPP